MENLNKLEILELYLDTASSNKPLLGDVYNKYNFTPEEKIKILSTFVKPESSEAHPVLDLSRQNLNFIPAEIVHVSVPTAKIQVHKKVLTYKEINLGYNPGITQLSEEDFKVLNHFEGVHLIGLRMKELPTEIHLLKNVIMLNFSWSDLVSLPESLFELNNIIGLKLNWTSISRFPDKFLNLDKLLFLEMAETPYMSILRSALGKSESLTSDQEQAIKIKNFLDQIGCAIEE